MINAKFFRTFDGNALKWNGIIDKVIFLNCKIATFIQPQMLELRSKQSCSPMSPRCQDMPRARYGVSDLDRRSSFVLSQLLIDVSK